MHRIVQPPKNITIEKWLEKKIEDLPLYSNLDNQINTYYNPNDKELEHNIDADDNDCVFLQYKHENRLYMKKVYIQKNTVRYSVDMIFKELVDICYSNNIMYNGLPLIGPHNKNAFKQFLFYYS